MQTDYRRMQKKNMYTFIPHKMNSNISVHISNKIIPNDKDNYCRKKLTNENHIDQIIILFPLNIKFGKLQMSTITSRQYATSR